jgi:membrane protein implicated in regulation of membrane protease activity
LRRNWLAIIIALIGPVFNVVASALFAFWFYAILQMNEHYVILRESNTWIAISELFIASLVLLLNLRHLIEVMAKVVK